MRETKRQGDRETGRTRGQRERGTGGQSEVGYHKMERWGKGGIAKRGAYEVRGVSLLTYDTPHRRKTAEQSATDTTDVKQKKDNLSIILSGGA